MQNYKLFAIHAKAFIQNDFVQIQELKKQGDLLTGTPVFPGQQQLGL